MLHSGRFNVVLDACVLYPAPLRDFLLRLASEDLYHPVWSDLIQQEWKRNLLANRRDLKESQLNKTISFMNKAFPDAEVNGFYAIIDSLTLPDDDDRHVLAAAIRSGSELIVTFNLKDFPATELSKYDVEAQHPDVFIEHLIDLDSGKAISAFKALVSSLKNPPKMEKEVLKILEANGLKKSVDLLDKLLSGKGN